MIRTLFILISLAIIGVTCHNKLRKVAAPCYYSYLNKDSISYDISHYTKVIDIDFPKKNKNFTEVFYYSFEYDGPHDSECSLAFVFDNTNKFFYKFDYKKELELKKAVSDKRSEKEKLIIQKLIKEEHRFIDRKCLISGGSKGILLIRKGAAKNVKYFYESDGYECDVIGENNQIVDLVKLIQLIKKDLP